MLDLPRGCTRFYSHPTNNRTRADVIDYAAPIIGATKIAHLEDAIGSLSVTLSREEVAYLEEPYVPHAIIGRQ